MPRRHANARSRARRRDEAVIVLRSRPAYTPPGWGSGWRRYRRTGTGLRRTYATLAAVLAVWVAVTAVVVWRWG